MFLFNSKNIGRVNLCYKVKSLLKALFDDAKFYPAQKKHNRCRVKNTKVGSSMGL